ncbi:MAG: hypothetical protein KDC34_18040 [Saprospiraceae bacterium]|nr:hypothetical protein [Saprospiraceae bacterium]
MHAILLGSGLGAFADAFEIRQRIPYAELSGSFVPDLEGHARTVLVAEYNGKTFLILSGKYHFYEGLEARILQSPFEYILSHFPIRSIILTATSGAFHPEVETGAWQWVRQILTLQPLFPNSAKAGIRYKSKIQSSSFPTLRASNYGFQTGPSLGTRAEYEALVRMGADLVGMSLLPEKSYLQKRGIAHSCLSLPVVNYHPISESTEPGHTEVLRIAQQGSIKLAHIFMTYLDQHL